MKTTANVLLAGLLAGTLAQTATKSPTRYGPVYPDGRPCATLRLEAKDQGVILKHGDRPGQCDELGARAALIFEEKGVYHQML